MRTATKVKVNGEVGVRRPIRIHLTVAEATRLDTLLQDTLETVTGYELDGHEFYTELTDAIDLF